MTRRHPLVAFYVRCIAVGFALAAMLTAVLLWADVGGLRHLVGAVQGGWLAAFLLWFFNGIVLTGAQASVAVLLRAEPEGGSGTGGDAVPAALRVPVK